jgi:hypothetical protein
MSAGLWFLLQSLAPARSFGWAFAIPTFAVSLLASVALLVSGSRLRSSGTARRQEVQLEAVKALVQHRRGPISAADVAGALQLPEPEVDQLLTQLAHRQATAVTGKTPRWKSRSRTRKPRGSEAPHERLGAQRWPRRQPRQFPGRGRALPRAVAGTSRAT